MQILILVPRFDREFVNITKVHQFKQVTHSDTNLRLGQYLTHAHTTRTVAATDSWVGFTGDSQQ